MQTKQELDALKEELYALKDKLAELTEEELEQVSGGAVFTGKSVKDIKGIVEEGKFRYL